MDLDALQKFLAKVGQRRFVDYAVQYGSNPLEGLENRVGWAWRMRRSKLHAEEARFLIDNESPLRDLCHGTEGGVHTAGDQWEDWDEEEATHAARPDEILDMQNEAHHRAQNRPPDPAATEWDDWEDDDGEEATVVVSNPELLAQTRQSPTDVDGWDGFEDEEATMVARPMDMVALRQEATTRAAKPRWEPATSCASCGTSLEGVTAYWHADKRWRCRDCFRAGR